ncbi:hypothetical protein Q3304_20050 [Clostridioides sp. GD02377]|uniref:hypothetical protein n=1 Tax=unclassified Clostridioides TaxID=2635829 RepID=UPI001D119ECD|nr:hypothetical protein [Clostridioides sp. ES-S-0145-01]
MRENKAKKIFIDIYNKIISFSKEQSWIRDMSRKWHIVILLLGFFLVIFSYILFDKKIFLLNENNKFLYLSGMFFSGLSLVAINFNLKNKCIQKILIILLIILYLSNDRMKVFFPFFFVLMLSCMITYEFWEIFITFMTFMIYSIIGIPIFSAVLEIASNYIHSFDKYAYGIIYGITTFELILYLPIGYFGGKIINKIFVDNIDRGKYSYRLFTNIVTLIYIIIFVMMNLYGYLYIDGIMGKVYSIFNNSFLTIVTITQISGKEIFLNNFKIRFNKMKEAAITLKATFFDKELNK